MSTEKIIKNQNKLQITLLYLCQHIKSSLVWFYGISIIIGYLIPNTIHTYILNICDL